MTKGYVDPENPEVTIVEPKPTNGWFKNYLNSFNLHAYQNGEDTGEVRFRMPPWLKDWVNYLAGDHQSIEMIETAAWLYGYRTVINNWGYDPHDLGKHTSDIKLMKISGVKYADMPSFKSDEDLMGKNSPQSTVLNIAKPDLRDKGKIQSFLETNQSKLSRHFLYIACHLYDEQSKNCEIWKAITPKARDLTNELQADFEQRLRWIKTSETPG